MTSTTEATALLARLNALEKQQPLSIVHLAEPILEAAAAAEGNNATQRALNTSSRDFSASITTAPDTTAPPTAQHLQLTPSSLSFDLQHYRDLFSKLRFSYLEQVTKEKYLRSIVGDPPLLVTPKDNAELEEKLAGMKRELKLKKGETDVLVLELEAFARELAVKYEGVQAGKVLLETLPGEVQGLRVQVEELREEVRRKQAEIGGEGAGDEGGEGMQRDWRYAMGMEATREALDERKRQAAEIDREIQELERRLPGKVRECERVERELEDMDRRKEEVTRQAKEVKGIREEGGRDLVGERGRWYTAQESVLKGLLQV